MKFEVKMFFSFFRRELVKEKYNDPTECVWSPIETEPPHVTCMKKAEIACSDGTVFQFLQFHLTIVIHK